ncbi:MAG: ATP-binding protein [Candidatus Eremiobacteraeota bacterium]|nr:ATP-binding protein [Candidatus Eremiobacteraeota bacterium]
MNYLNYPARMEYLPGFLDYIRNEMIDLGINMEIIFEVELACEEILVNIIKYAYSGKVGDIDVGVEYEDEGEFIVYIIDRGECFNILQVENPDVEASLDERDEGGLGIHFARSLMDEIDYKRDEDKNIVIMKKRILRKQGSGDNENKK